MHVYVIITVLYFLMDNNILLFYFVTVTLSGRDVDPSPHLVPKAKEKVELYLYST
jgi:hypothetical protein